MKMVRNLRRIEQNNIIIIRNLRKLRFMLENLILSNKKILHRSKKVNNSNLLLQDYQMNSRKYHSNLIITKTLHSIKRIQIKIIAINIDRNNMFKLIQQKLL